MSTITTTSISRRRWFSVAAAVALTSAGVAGCAPGSSTAPETQPSAGGKISKDVAAAGNVTLTVWDQNTDGGIDDAQQKLNSQFQQKYPNVKINRVSRSFADLKTTLGLALGSKDAPDVVQANQGYPDMGAFVQAGYLRPVNDYADLYGWNQRFPEQQRKLNSFSADGKTWQGDNLYGISQTGELVGIYYNKSLLNKLGIEAPKTLTELDAAFAKAKSAGTLPLEFGDQEKSPGIHIFGVTQAALAGQQAVNDLVSGRSGAWTDQASVQAAQTISDWSTKGYLPAGVAGISRDAARDRFIKGGSAFYLDGTWQLADISKGMGGNVGFLALNPPDSSTPVTTGGVGLAWAVTSKTKNPDVAAAYVDFLTNADAATVLVDTGNLPAVLPEGDAPKEGTLDADITAEWKSINAGNGLVPYLDYSTTTFYDTLSASMQELLAGKVDAQKFTETLQADYSKFQSSK